MKEFIVVIEDEEDLLELLEYNLQKEGFDVEGFIDTRNVEKLLNEQNVDLMIVDRNLPTMEGSEFVKYLRKKGYSVPVIFLSAKNEDYQKIEGFISGGDDYVTKPFNLNELMFRVKALLNRVNPFKEKIQYRDIVMDMSDKSVLIDSVEIDLTKKEFELLAEFIKNKNIVLTRETILERVWGGDEVCQDRTVDVCIKRLKEKIDPNRDRNYIVAVRGVGYKLC
jgi:DNA-binding response OmpR family regulator